MEVGDTAIVAVGYQFKEYFIQEISPEGIYIMDPDTDRVSLLVQMNGVWKVKNYPLPHTVEFQKQIQPALAKVEELDFEILLNLDFPSLEEACRVNRYLYLICQKDYFWQKKVERDFGDLGQYKPDDITYRDQYEDLLYPSLVKAIRKNRVDLLEALSRQGTLPTAQDVNEALFRSNWDVLEWMKLRGILPDEDASMNAIEYEDYDALKWLADAGVIDPVAAADIAAGQGRLDILEEYAEENILPTFIGAGLAAERGDFEILEWLEGKGILPDAAGVFLARAAGEDDVVEWLAERGIFG